MLSLTPTTTSSSTDECRQGIVWLASYLKSGNTWFRVFLQNLLHGTDNTQDVRGIHGFSSDRQMFDDYSGLDSSDLTADEVDMLRPRVYEALVERSKSLPLFMKVHDGYTYLPDGRPLMSPRASAGAIYFLRNPLDVAVSFAYHMGSEDFAMSVKAMGWPGMLLSETQKGLTKQLRQRLLDWSGHVKSWLDQTEVPVHVVKYEDMLSRPLETFRGAVRFAGLNHDDTQIARALEESQFEKLQQKEREGGFIEKSSQTKVFFREGKSGGWRAKLTDDLVEKLIFDHGDMMRRFNYLDPHNTILV